MRDSPNEYGRRIGQTRSCRPIDARHGQVRSSGYFAVRGAGWIAFADNISVGYLLAVYVFSLEHTGIDAEIDEFLVVPAGRASGVGSELLRMAETEFIRLGCTNVSLQLSRENHSARRFYRRYGYAERSGFELLDKMLHRGWQRKRALKRARSFS